MMQNIGMLSLLYGVITPTVTTPSAEIASPDQHVRAANRRRVNHSEPRATRSASYTPGLYSYVSDSRVAIERLLFGYHVKTKRSLAEEAESGDETSVFSWIKDGTDPNEVDTYGYTPLLNAATLGRINTVAELIRNGADVNKKGQFGYTALHAAAQNGHREVVFLLLKHDADINAQNDDQDTPMHLALSSHYIEIVYMLLRHGADAHIVGHKDKDCVKIAREIGLPDLAKTLKNFNPTMGLHPISSPQFRQN